MEKYIPVIYQKSIYTIDYSKLLSNGITCLLYDLDNTIISLDSKEMPEKAKDLFISLKQKGFKVILFSNSPKSKVDIYKKYLNVDGIHLALKPYSIKFKKLIKNYRLKVDEIAIIGDQIMTDVVGGNKIGITTILVNPITTNEHIFSKINRILERRKIKKLEAKNLFRKGKYYD